MKISFFTLYFRFETKEATNSTTDSEAKAGSPVKSGMTDAEKAAARAARFGASIDVASDAKKQARAERFGTKSGTSKIGAAPSVDLDTLKKRAERFGQSSATGIISNPRKLKKNKISVCIFPPLTSHLFPAPFIYFPDDVTLGFITFLSLRLLQF